MVEIAIKEGYELYIILVMAVYLFLSVLFFKFSRKEKNDYKKKVLLVSAVLFLIAPILTIVGAVIGHVGLIIFGFITPLGLFLCMMSAEIVVRYYKCNTKVIGTYCNMNLVSNYRGNAYYAPEFSYPFEGRRYRSQSFLSYKYKKFNKKHIKNNEYELYINPIHPEDVVVKTFFPMNVFILVVISLVFVFIGVATLVAA